MIVIPSFKKQKRDYVTIERYIPSPSRRDQKRMQYKKRDVLYILVCSLILSGLMQKAHSKILAWFPPKPSVIVAASMTTNLPTPTPKTIIKFIKGTDDIRATRLQEFLESKSSPLAPYAGHIIKASDEKAIDWTLLVSIAGKESSYGQNVPPGTYNPFGLGGRSFMHFSSWEEAIDYEANLLSEHYRASMVAGIQSKYCPDYECASDWTQSVVSFAKEILAVDKKETGIQK